MRWNTDSQLHKRKVQLEERGRYSLVAPRGIPTAIKPNGPTTETFYHKSCAEALRFSFQGLTLFLYAAFTSFACAVSQLRLAEKQCINLVPISYHFCQPGKISQNLKRTLDIHVSSRIKRGT